MFYLAYKVVTKNVNVSYIKLWGEFTKTLDVQLLLKSQKLWHPWALHSSVAALGWG